MSSSIRRTARGLFSAAALGVVLLLGSCLPLGKETPSLTESEIVGEWESIEGEGESTITFSSDHRFVIEALPAGVVNQLPDGLSRAEGMWGVSEDRFENLPFIDLEFDDGPPGLIMNSWMYARGEPGNRTLFFIVGDPDSRDWVDYKRVE